jgi:hypothetical protein
LPWWIVFPGWKPDVFRLIPRYTALTTVS